MIKTALDISSFLTGGGIALLLIIIGLLAFISLAIGKVRHQLKYVLTKLYSRTSLMLIAVWDVVAMFDPTQTLLGIPVGIVAGITVFFSEWGLHDKFAKKRIGGSLIEGLIAALIVMIPLPVAGLFVAWFGMAGDKKKK